MLSDWSKASNTEIVAAEAFFNYLSKVSEGVINLFSAEQSPVTWSKCSNFGQYRKLNVTHLPWLVPESAVSNLIQSGYSRSRCLKLSEILSWTWKYKGSWEMMMIEDQNTASKRELIVQVISINFSDGLPYLWSTFQAFSSNNNLQLYNLSWCM